MTMEGPREIIEETITSQIEKELGKAIDFTKKTESIKFQRGDYFS